MVQKRHHEEIDEFGIEHQRKNQRHELWISMALWSSIRKISLTKDLFELERIRQVVRDEVERVILPHNLQSPRKYPLNEAETSRGRDLRLHFCNQPAKNIFTLKDLRADDGKPVQVVLCGTSSENDIVRSGPLSSAKVDILVINADFGSGNHEDWNMEKFQKHVLSARAGKRPLLVGILTIILNDGVGFIVDLKFTDNSKWTPSNTFRLGARMTQNKIVERVREAVSEPFRVKDHRGDRNKKHHPPQLEDELWRLDGISKGGQICERLASNKVITVKDFLQKIETDPSSLRAMISRIADRDWKKLVEHARECVIDNKLYAYCGFAILFNSIHQVVSARFDGQDFFCSVDGLDVNQQYVVNSWREDVYKNLGGLIQVNSQFPMDLKPLSSLFGMPYTGPSTSVQNFDLADTIQSSPNFGFAVTQDQPDVECSTSYNLEANLGTDAFSDTEKSMVGVDDLQISLANQLTNSTIGYGSLGSTLFGNQMIIETFHTQVQDSFPGQQFNAAREEDFLVSDINFQRYNGETN